MYLLGPSPQLQGREYLIVMINYHTKLVEFEISAEREKTLRTLYERMSRTILGSKFRSYFNAF